MRQRKRQRVENKQIKKKADVVPSTLLESILESQYIAQALPLQLCRSGFRMILEPLVNTEAFSIACAAAGLVGSTKSIVSGWASHPQGHANLGYKESKNPFVNASRWPNRKGCLMTRAEADNEYQLMRAVIDQTMSQKAVKQRLMSKYKDEKTIGAAIWRMKAHQPRKLTRAIRQIRSRGLLPSEMPKPDERPQYLTKLPTQLERYILQFLDLRFIMENLASLNRSWASFIHQNALAIVTVLHFTFPKVAVNFDNGRSQYERSQVARVQMLQSLKNRAVPCSVEHVKIRNRDQIHTIVDGMFPKLRELSCNIQILDALDNFYSTNYEKRVRRLTLTTEGIWSAYVEDWRLHLRLPTCNSIFDLDVLIIDLRPTYAGAPHFLTANEERRFNQRMDDYVQLTDLFARRIVVLARAFELRSFAADFSDNLSLLSHEPWVKEDKGKRWALEPFDTAFVTHFKDNEAVQSIEWQSELRDGERRIDRRLVFKRSTDSHAFL